MALPAAVVEALRALRLTAPAAAADDDDDASVLGLVGFSGWACSTSFDVDSEGSGVMLRSSTNS